MEIGETGESGVFATRSAEEAYPLGKDIVTTLHQDIMADIAREEIPKVFLVIPISVKVFEPIAN